MSDPFGGRAEFDVDASHIFPQSVLAAITLVADGAGDEGASSHTGCEVRLPLCSVAITTLSGESLIPSCWCRSPVGQA